MNLRSRLAHDTQCRLLILAAMVIFTFVAAHGANASPVLAESVGFTSSPRGHVLVPVSIDGSEPLVFVLDTGAGKTLVTPQLLERLDLETAPGERVSTLGMNGKTESGVVEIQTVAVGDIRVADIQAIVLDLDYVTRGDWHVYGVLGMDFLSQFDLRLDFEGRTVSFYPAASELSNCIACPKGLDGHRFETISPKFIVLPATVDGKAVNALLDTGSGHSGLNVKAAETLGVNLPALPDGAPAGHRFGLQTGPVRVGQTTLTERAALHVMDHPIMEELGLADRPGMLMGTDQLKGRAVTICYDLETLFLQ